MGQIQDRAALNRRLSAAGPWLAPAGAGAASLGVLLWSLPKGFDLTDEGYYLTEIAHPGDTTSTALLFGWPWHPVYTATGGSVIGLRVVAFVLVAALAVALTHAALGLLPARSRPGRTTLTCLCVVSGALAFLPLSSLPSTPSYNTLAWLSIAAAGLGCALAWSRRRPILGGTVVGLAGFGAATAKPTTALALAVVVVATTPWSHQGLRPVVATAVTLVLSFTALVAFAPGHLDGLVTVVAHGVDATIGHGDLVRRDPYSFSTQLLLMLTVAGAGGAAAGLLTRRHAVWATLTGGVAVGAAIVSLSWWVQVGLMDDIDEALPVASLTGFGVLGVSSVVSLGLKGRSNKPDFLTLRLAALLAVLPAAYAFGTNNNIWQWSGQAVVFWFVAIVLLTGTTSPFAAAAGGLAAYTALVAAVITPLDPYRTGLPVQAEASRVSLAGAVLRLPHDEARATAEMLAVGERLGVTRETEVLDLTGASPGVVWAWGARPLASAWLIGGYPGSLAAARVAIGPKSCDLTRALVLWAPGQPRAIPAQVLTPWHVNVPKDYRVVASFPRVTVPATRTQPTATVESVMVLEPVSVKPQGCPGS